MVFRVIVFYVLTFVFTILLGGFQEAAGISQFAVILPQLAPGLAALLMLPIFRKDGYRFSFIDRSLPASRYLKAALIPLGAAAAIYLINSLILGSLTFGDTSSLPWALLLWMPFGAIGEELGWRGYLHKRLNFGLSGLLSCVIVGLLWGLWHVGMYQNGALYMAFFLLLMVSYSIVIFSIVAEAGFNVLLAAIFHLMINFTNIFSLNIINDITFMIVNSLVWAVIAIAVAARSSLFKGKPSVGQP
jgi:membrane protease YdiL (CAAX protease family)